MNFGPRLFTAKLTSLLPNTVLLMVLAGLVGSGQRLVGQAVESATAERTFLWVGGGVSGYEVQYGYRKLLGPTVWVDADASHHFGIEGEARWLDYHQQASVHVETYLAGARYHFSRGRFQPYARLLGGPGYFNFPYNYASGRYLVVAPGGGIDYRLSGRWSARADFEYQYWPQFTFGAMSSVGGTIGLRFRVH